MRKLCLSTKFPHQEIRWNYGILRSAFCLIFRFPIFPWSIFCQINQSYLKRFLDSTFLYQLHPEAYSEPCQISKMECFSKIVKGCLSLTIFAKCSILDVWQGSEYATDTGKLFWCLVSVDEIISRNTKRGWATNWFLIKTGILQKRVFYSCMRILQSMALRILSIFVTNLRTYKTLHGAID